MQLLHGLSELLLVLCLIAWLLLAGLSRMVRWAAREQHPNLQSNRFEIGIDWALNVFVAAIVVWAITGWFLPAKKVSREGAICGPHHHWKLVGSPGNEDLACEGDR